MKYNSLFEWCKAIIEFLISNNPDLLFRTKKAELEKIDDQKSYAKLKLLYRELYSIICTSPHSERELLNNFLRSRFGKDVEDVSPVLPKFRTLTGKKFELLQFQRDWCLTILDFAINADSRMSMIPTREIVESTYARHNLKGLTMVFNDLTEMMQNSGAEKLKELNSLLYNRFGRDLNFYSRKKASLIKRILRKGFISNDDEYRTVDQEISDLLLYKPDSETIQALDKLMADFNIGRKT